MVKKTFIIQRDFILVESKNSFLTSNPQPETRNSEQKITYLVASFPQQKHLNNKCSIWKKKKSSQD